MSDIDDRVNDLIQPAIDLALLVPDGFSTSIVQRKFRVGYPIAIRVVEELRRRGFVGEYNQVTGYCPVYLEVIKEGRG